MVKTSLPLLGAQVHFLVRELRSCKPPRSAAKKKKKKKKKIAQQLCIHTPGRRKIVMTATISEAFNACISNEIMINTIVCVITILGALQTLS